MSNENTSPAAKTSSVVTVRDVQTESFEAPAPSSVERSVGVMNTAKASHGGTLSGVPGDGDVVTVNGMTMTLSTALKHGFVAQDAQSRYVDLPADSEQAKEYEKEQTSDEHTSELQSLMRITYADFCMNENTKQTQLSQRIKHT